MLPVKRNDGFHGQTRCHFTGPVPPHAIQHEKEPHVESYVGTILIDGPLLAHIGYGPAFNNHVSVSTREFGMPLVFVPFPVVQYFSMPRHALTLLRQRKM